MHGESLIGTLLFLPIADVPLAVLCQFTHSLCCDRDSKFSVCGHLRGFYGGIPLRVMPRFLFFASRSGSAFHEEWEQRNTKATI